MADMQTPARQANAAANIGIRVTNELKRTLQEAAAAENVTLSHYCARILTAALASEEAA